MFSTRSPASRPVRDITEELGRSRQALTDFTRAVTHDLRAPLQAVQGYVDLLRAHLQAGHVHEVLFLGERIERAAQRMDGMVQALARLLELERKPIERAAVDMQCLAQETWTIVAAGEPGRNVDLSLHSLPATRADAALVAQIWQNLLDNAWKYTARSAQPKVAVDSWRDGRGTWYRVADNGAGFRSIIGSRFTGRIVRTPSTCRGHPMSTWVHTHFNDRGSSLNASTWPSPVDAWCELNVR